MSGAKVYRDYSLARINGTFATDALAPKIENPGREKEETCFPDADL
jgi:hypothetical protein